MYVCMYTYIYIYIRRMKKIARESAAKGLYLERNPSGAISI